MPLEIIDRDLGWRDILAASEAADGAEIFFGSTGGAAADSYIEPVKGMPLEISVAGILAVHEFGIGVPERSVIRAWLASGAPELKGSILGVFDVILDGEDRIERSLEGQGEVTAKALRKFISGGRVKPGVSEATAERRGDASALTRDGGNKSLLDTKQILDSISFRVEV